MSKDEVLRNFGKFYLARRLNDDEGETMAKWNPFTLFHGEIREFLAPEILEKEDSSGLWRLIGDETFENDGALLRYIWVVVPPNTGLPTAMDFHATDSTPAETKALVAKLLSKADANREAAKRVQIHIFDGESGHGSGEEDYTQRVLPYTLPVLMEAIRSTVGGDSSNRTSSLGIDLQMLVEGYSGGISKAGEVMPLVSSYEDRAGNWHSPYFRSKQYPPKRFLPKDGHPLLSYPDAVGMSLKPGPADYRNALNHFVHRWTFEEAKVLSDGLLSKSSLSRAKDFYRHLRELPAPSHPNLSKRNSLLEQIVNHYSTKLATELSVTDFLEFEESSRDIPNYSWASERMIEDRGGIDAWIGEIPKKAYRKRFDTHFSGFSHASRMSDSSEMTRHINEIEILRLNPESNLDQSRVREFALVLEAELHTKFVFTKEDRAAALLDDSSSRLENVAVRAFEDNAEDRDRHYLGSRLQRDAFRDGPLVSDRTLELQRRLRDAKIESDDERILHRRRHTTYLLEMLIDRSRLDPVALEEAEHIRKEGSREEGVPDLWRLAAVIKLAVSLRENGRPIPGTIVNLVDSLPRDPGSSGNPNIRCMSWGARLCDILGLAKERKKFVSQIRNRAVGAIEGSVSPYKDAMGLTHACHILDLERHDWGSGAKGVRIGEEYLELVLENSAESTRKWYADNAPTEEDALRPLNFNYR